MELDKNIMYNKIKKRNFNIKKEDLIEIIYSTFTITQKILHEYNFEKENDILNPLLWEYGHFIYFWYKLVLKNIKLKNNKNRLVLLKLLYKLDLTFYHTHNLYDSHKTKLEYRYKYYNKLLPQKYLNDMINEIYNTLLYIVKFNYSKINSYLIYLGCAHQDMHNESFLFSFNQVYLPSPIKFDLINNSEPIYKTTIFIKINFDKFKQGVSDKTKSFYFDNEYPQFKVNINSFHVSKHCITNYQYLQFVKAGGYTIKNYWSIEGWDYINDNRLVYPKHWMFDNNIWYEQVFDNYYYLRNNFPVTVSWYEAKAYCRWAKCRLLYESEWEYLADNNDNAILDYTSPQSVLTEKNKNRFGIYGLYGNYWEWCEDNIYPYDGYIIDPVYREMSYPFFGYKKICRGGSWCTPKYLATRTYRNAQYPSCNYQFISFRVAF